jgi:threonyl-tRNA synthetase
MRTGNIGAFKLTSVAAAYYKGDEKGPQLQRIYGTAFKNKTALDEYFKMIEEAKRRDHRKIGAEMGLFAIDTEYVGPGMPLWLPKGTAIVEELEKLAKETEFAAGYVRVKTPHLAKEKMYKTSGHLPYYADSMFPPMELLEPGFKEAKKRPSCKAKVDELKKIGAGKRIQRPARKAMLEDCGDHGTAINALGERYYYLKAMNCPHHHRIFAAEPRSYRDLPLRLAEYGTCYRYEQSGELFGLMRVRAEHERRAHLLHRGPVRAGVQFA